MRIFFEGPAGSGKTHQLVARTVTVAPEALTDPRHRLLALTFMNGARLRLSARLSDVGDLRGRVQCTTFDAFAGMVTNRLRSLLQTLPILSAQGMNAFDVTCRDAARLLEIPHVQRWIAASHPLVVVDEAQDLNEYRFGMLRALADCANVIAAADEFQNLASSADTTELLTWLRDCDESVSLAQIHRTSQTGLLTVAAALRAGTDVRLGLAERTTFQHVFVGQGIRIVEVPATNVGVMAWSVANELAALSSHTAVLTANATDRRMRQVISRLQSAPFTRNKTTGATFGPFPLIWERNDEEEAEDILKAVPGTSAVPIADAIAAIRTLNCPERRTICERIDAARVLRGETHVSRERLRAVVEHVVRNGRRFGTHMEATGRRVMTIPRAKNREFGDVVVVWPQSVPGEIEPQRRLLYNAVTRAKRRCSVVVFGAGRLGQPPFSGTGS